MNGWRQPRSPRAGSLGQSGRTGSRGERASMRRPCCGWSGATRPWSVMKTFPPQRPALLRAHLLQCPKAPLEQICLIESPAGWSTPSAALRAGLQELAAAEFHLEATRSSPSPPAALQIGPEEGQLVIPAELREKMKLPTGAKLSIQPRRQCACPDARSPRSSSTAFIGGTSGVGLEREAVHRDDEERSSLSWTPPAPSSDSQGSLTSNGYAGYATFSTQPRRRPAPAQWLSAGKR